MKTTLAQAALLGGITLLFSGYAGAAHANGGSATVDLGVIAPIGTQLLGGPPPSYDTGPYAYSAGFTLYDAAPGNSYWNNGIDGISVTAGTIIPYVSQSIQNQVEYNGLLSYNGGYNFIYNIQVRPSVSGTLYVYDIMTQEAPLANQLNSVSLYQNNHLIETGSTYDVIQNGVHQFSYATLQPILVSAQDVYTLSISGSTGPEGFSELTGMMNLNGAPTPFVTPPGSVPVAAVPEPSTWAMMLLGFAGLGLAGYRRTKAAPSTFAPA